MKNQQPQIKLTCLLATACFALAGTIQAIDTASDGRYQNPKTAERKDAIFSLTPGADNAAMGLAALYSNTTGSDNVLASWIWRGTGRLSTARYFHTATLLQNGMVLVAGGQSAGTVSASAELYDPGSETWTPTGSLNIARDSHTATLLQNGMVLVAGGRDSTGHPSSSAELYDPASGTWTTTVSFNTARYSHTATMAEMGSADGRNGVRAKY